MTDSAPSSTTDSTTSPTPHSTGSTETAGPADGTLALVSGIDFDGRDPPCVSRMTSSTPGTAAGWPTSRSPADKAEYAAFTALHDTAQERLRDIITDLAADAPSFDSVPGKIAALYASFMDTDSRNDLGLAPLQPLLDEVSALESTAQLAGLFGRWDRSGLGAPIGTVVHQDNMDSTRYLLDLRQSGLGLPDRDYYLEDTFADIRADYAAHIARMWELAGFGTGEDAADVATRVLALETRLAEAQWDKVRNRDPRPPTTC